MVKFLDNRIHIILEPSFSTPEDLDKLIQSLLWYMSHIPQDCLLEDENYYMCELLSSMLPDHNDIKFR